MEKSICNIPSCVNYQRYCRLHLGIKEIKPHKKIKQFSSEREKVNRSRYLPEARKFITANPNCKLKLRGCTGKVQGVHHKKGKATIELLLDKRYWEPSCNHCNVLAEVKDAESRAKGIKLSRLTKSDA